MTHPIRIGGLFRCCFLADMPADAKEGDTAPCPHCSGGLRLVTRPGEAPAWEAAWITLGHEWRKEPGA